MKFLMLAFVLFTQCLFSGNYKYDLAVGAIFRDEARFLKEWIEFHKLVGVQHFYMYNNLSQDHYLEVLNPYIQSGEVELFQWPYDHGDQWQWNGIQCAAYDHLIARVRDEVKWLAIIDADEMIVPIEHGNILDFLRDFEEYSGVGINWQQHGTSHVWHIPDNCLMIEKLLWKGRFDIPDHYVVKSIIQPKKVICTANPHFFVYSEGFQVNADKIPFDGCTTEYIAIDQICINHYWSRDIDHFLNVKWPRAIKYNQNPRFEDYFRHANEIFNEAFDPFMERFVPELKKRMGFSPSTL